MSRPKAKIDLGELEKLCTMQCTDEEIAAWFGVSSRTIERRRSNQKFREAMERGKAKGRVSMRRNLHKIAQTGNVAAAIFLGKNYLGMRDVVRNEQTGADGGPIAIDSRPDLSNLTDEELELLRSISEKTIQKPDPPK